MHSIVLWATRSTATACKGRSNELGRQHQRRAVCGLPKRRNGVQWARVAGWSRVRAVLACDAGAVTHIYFAHELSPPTPHARTPHISSAHTVPQARHSCIHRTARTHLDHRFFASIVTFVLPSYRATLCLHPYENTKHHRIRT